MYYHHHHHQSNTPPPSGIHGGLLEVTVVGCTKLKDTEWISRQDPYVCIEYGSSKFRTRTCTDGHKNPTFQEKFNLTLIEGIREIHVKVWNSNTLSTDDFIGSGKIQLQKVLSEGFDDNSWTLHSKSGRYAGEVRLIMHYANSQKPTSSAPSPTPPLYYYSAVAAAPPPPPPQYPPPPPPPAQVGANYNSYPPPLAQVGTNYNSYPPPPPPATYNNIPPNYPYNPPPPPPPVAQPYYYSSPAPPAAAAYPPPSSASPYHPSIYPPRPY